MMENSLDRIGYLYLNNGCTNSFDISFLSQIEKNIEKLEVNNDIHIVVILSNLSFSFSSGLDLKELYMESDKNQTANNVYNIVKKMYNINKKIQSSQKIYIAAMQGPVIGSAMSLALSCDLRVADRQTWFWLPDPQYGGLLADGGIELLRSLIGTSRANMLLLTCDRLNATDAHQWGLLYKIFDASCFIKKVQNMCNKLSDYSIKTLISTKRIVNKNILTKFESQLLNDIVSDDEMVNYLERYL